MTDFPAQTDATAAADPTEADWVESHDDDANHDDANHDDGTAVESMSADDDADDAQSEARADDNPVPAQAVDREALGHLGNGVYQSAGGAFNGAADRVNDRFHEMAGRAGDAISQATDEAGERIAGATQAAVTRIRNNASLPASRGTTTIANEVVEKIAGIAARDVPGVYDLGGDTVRLLSTVREKLHLGEESKAQGIAVRLNGKEADLSITIVLEYGFVVSSVTDTVREKTISAVETLLGLDVTNVDILVDDIHVDHDGPVGDDANRAAGYSSGTPGITVGG
jgi:uncharacterized alkaline shock family protein YloU